MTGLATTRAINRSAGHMYTVVEQGKVLGPFPGATALTSLQDSLGGSDGLMNWGINLALDEVKYRLPEMASYGRADDQETEWLRIRQLALQAKNRARDLGTAVHAVCDQINRGQPPNMFTDGVAPYVAQYGAALYQKRITILGSEKYAVNADIGPHLHQEGVRGG